MKTRLDSHRPTRQWRLENPYWRHISLTSSSADGRQGARRNKLEPRTCINNGKLGSSLNKWFFKLLYKGNIYTVLTWPFVTEEYWPKMILKWKIFNGTCAWHDITLTLTARQGVLNTLYKRSGIACSHTKRVCSVNNKSINQMAMHSQGPLWWRKLTHHFPAKHWSCYTDTSACLAWRHLTRTQHHIKRGTECSRKSVSIWEQCKAAECSALSVYKDGRYERCPKSEANSSWLTPLVAGYSIGHKSLSPLLLDGTLAKLKTGSKPLINVPPKMVPHILGSSYHTNEF